MLKRGMACLILVLLSAMAFADARNAVQKAVASLGDAYMGVAPQAAFKRGIALLPLKAPEDLARLGAADAVAAYIREKLSQSTVFVLVERSNMDAILQEIEFGLSGLADLSRTAEAGELLGAELLLQGGLSETGDGISLSLEIVDVSTARVLASVTRAIERADLIREADDLQRSAFRSQYGLSIEAGAGTLFGLAETYVPDYDQENVGVKQGRNMAVYWNSCVSYRVLPFLSLDFGALGIESLQMYFSSDGRIVSPLKVGGERSIRYSMFHGTGVVAGLGFIYSPLARLNLRFNASGFGLISHRIEHWFMDYACYDIGPVGTVDVVNRDIMIDAIARNPPFGAIGGIKADFLVSRRLSVGLSVDYLWMPPYSPWNFRTGNTLRASNEGPSKNGLFDSMGGFNVAYVDGSEASGVTTYDPSGVVASLSLAIHF